MFKVGLVGDPIQTDYIEYSSITMDQHLAENEESEGVNGHDCGMMIPTTIRSPTTEQVNKHARLT